MKKSLKEYFLSLLVTLLILSCIMFILFTDARIRGIGGFESNTAIAFNTGETGMNITILNDRFNMPFPAFIKNISTAFNGVKNYASNTAGWINAAKKVVELIFSVIN